MIITNVREFRQKIRHFTNLIREKEEHIIVTRHGKEHIVVLSGSEYTRLKDAEEKLLTPLKELNKKKLRIALRQKVSAGERT